MTALADGLADRTSVGVNNTRVRALLRIKVGNEQNMCLLLLNVTIWEPGCLCCFVTPDQALLNSSTLLHTLLSLFKPSLAGHVSSPARCMD
jgi:hypothetical protein